MPTLNRQSLIDLSDPSTCYVKHVGRSASIAKGTSSPHSTLEEISAHRMPISCLCFLHAQSSYLVRFLKKVQPQQQLHSLLLEIRMSGGEIVLYNTDNSRQLCSILCSNKKIHTVLFNKESISMFLAYCTFPDSPDCSVVVQKTFTCSLR